MTDEEIATIDKLCGVLKARKVRSFEITAAGNPKIEFESAPWADADTKPGVAAVDADPEMCKCGHPAYAHQNGLCIHACEPDKCLGPEVRQ